MKNAGIACLGAVTGLTRNKIMTREVTESTAEREMPKRREFNAGLEGLKGLEGSKFPKPYQPYQPSSPYQPLFAYDWFSKNSFNALKSSYSACRKLPLYIAAAG